jgi:hypothetical protein
MPKGPEKAYKNLDFLNSPSARPIRILCEYEEPRQRFMEQRVSDTIVFFGSARANPQAEVADKVAHLEREVGRCTDDAVLEELNGQLRVAQGRLRLSRFYDETRELARRLTDWDMQRKGDRRYYVSTGGGPGIMEAANRGAADVPGGRSVGLGISLPFEEKVNKFVSPELAFEFHYFFTRKYWFLYLAKALVVFPGGFGTMDELFETLTLVQTDKIKRGLPIVLFGTDYWSRVINLDAMAEMGTIHPDDIDLMYRTDDVDDAFAYIVRELEAQED